MGKGTDGVQVVACEGVLQLQRQVAQCLDIVAEDVTDYLRVFADQCSQCAQVEQRGLLDDRGRWRCVPLESSVAA
ncbi:hypothetical protein D3C80_1992490 [compost metagenome]